MDLSPAVLSKLNKVQRNELASLLQLSTEQKALLDTLSSQKSTDDLSSEIAALQSTVKSSSGIGAYKTVLVHPLAWMLLSNNSASPTKISPPSGCRLKITTLTSGYGAAIWHDGSSKTFEISLGDTQLVSSANQYLSGPLKGVGSGTVWYGVVNHNALTENSSRRPLQSISPLGCPVGGVDESLIMYATSSTSSYRSIVLGYEVIKDV